MDFLDGDPKSTDPIGLWRPNMSNSINRVRKPSHGFLQKLFSRQPGMPKLITENPENQTIRPQFDSSDDSSHIDLEVVPCPYIHPLENRLEPRIESTPLAPRRAAVESGRSISSKKQEASYASYFPLDKTYEKPHRKWPAHDAMSIRSLMRREDIVLAAAADASYLKEWDHYIRCYSEGRYSLTVPPGPPPKSSKFTYLPSTYPPNEMERLATFHLSQIWSGTDIEWSSLEVEGARSLIMAATKKFATPWAAISFFDRNSEIVQAERGYSRHLIPRHESIASHVLLTDEAMTVLDTQKDWRFSGNPLVIGNPKIRFFAGAPLLSANSQVIGVFSIFSPEPRASFTAVQRRDLLGLSELATQQLTARGDLPTSTELHNSTLLQPGSCDGSATNLYKSTSSPAPSLQIDSRRNSSVALRYHKGSKNATSRSRLFINSEGRDTHIYNGAHTPPSSDNSDAGPSPILVELKVFGKNHKQLSLVASPNQLPNDSRTPGSPIFADLSPNSGSLLSGAFSTNLDYLDPESNPYRADFSYMQNATESVARFRRRSMGFSSDDAADLLTPNPNSPIECVSGTSSLSTKLEGREPLLEEALFDERFDATFTNENGVVSASVPETRDRYFNSINHEAIHYQDDLYMSSAITPNLEPQGVHGSVDFQAEARFAAELWAKNLEFDAIYAVELIPKRKYMRYSKLITPGKVETCILVAYGLPDPIKFDIPIHLDVLGGPGAITWENKNAMPKEYSRGFMMPLLFENGILDYRSSGVVFGAFRRRPEIFKSAEVERLQRAATVLKDILSKWPLLRRPSQDEVEPLPSPSPQPYPSNEVFEVSKISFDAGMTTCVRRRKPENSIR